MSTTAEKIAEFEAIHGKLDEDRNVAGSFGKFSGMPWFLVSWYCEGYWDETKGSCQDIGFHALFVDIKNSTEYDTPDVVGYIVKESSDGFMNYEEYDTPKDLQNAWKSIQEPDYPEWEG